MIETSEFAPDDECDSEEGFSGTMQYLGSCISDLSDRIGIDVHLSQLLCILRSIWDSMSEEGRVLFHHSDAVLAYALDPNGLTKSAHHLGSADAYQQLVAQNWAGEQLISVAEDTEKLIETAWDCLGASERGKVLTLPAITALIEFYKKKNWW